MRNDKQLKGWLEFIRTCPDFMSEEELEHEASRLLKHLPIKMTDYYGPSWSGWHKYLSTSSK